MIHFECDYNEGAMPEILDIMVKTNMEQTAGYSQDVYCEQAKELIKKACNAPEADVHFLVGGTQTNKTVIQSYLKSYQGVLSAVSGHINTHETGTIEAGGHKVLSLDSDDGKIYAWQIEKAMIDHDGDCHFVQPGMVYISNPTEFGTIYTKEELTELSEICHKYRLPLYLDGARLGYALSCPENDLTLADYARLCDVFYIGGTKMGCLFGEAVVISNDAMKKDFRYNIKQNGGLLAKGRLLGIQFIPMFGEENLYKKAGDHAIKLSNKLKTAFKQLDIEFAYDSPTNQQFIILENSKLEELSKDFAVAVPEKIDENRSMIRICTNWATKEENVDALIEKFKEIYA